MPLTHLLQWTEFMALGLNEPDGPLDAVISSQKPNQCCTLIYTSGTTGQPKGVMLSHDNVCTFFTFSATVRIIKSLDICKPPQLEATNVPVLMFPETRVLTLSQC